MIRCPTREALRHAARAVVCQVDHSRRERCRGGCTVQELEPRRLLSGGLPAAPTGSGTGGILSTAPLVEDAAGDLFGITAGGGAGGDGAVFEVPAGGDSLTTVASFDGADGSGPVALAVGADGNLYGTTAAGGADGDGVVFEVAGGGRAITLIASFDGANGKGPDGNLILDSAGNLYGTTAAGGPAGAGTVFELPAGGHGLATLASFGGSDGSRPDALAADASGNLFGTTAAGGAAGDGTIFRIAAAGHKLSTLAAFAGGDGSAPASLVIDPSGNLYGASTGGGASGDGTLFEVAAGGDAITNLASFIPGQGAPSGLILDAAGDLLASTTGGSVVKLPKKSNDLSTLATFTPAAGIEQGLILDRTGSLYVATLGAGVANFKPVSLAVPAVTPDLYGRTKVVSHAALAAYVAVADAAGNLYGTIAAGDAGGGRHGAIVMVSTHTGAAGTLARFDGADGSDPFGLVTDAAGDLFGVTDAGGPGGDGALFEVPAGGRAVTLLASFRGAGLSAPDSFFLGADGNLYGSTSGGGANGDGAVFEVKARTHKIITLLSLDASDGSNPTVGAADRAGNLYGTTDGPSSGDPGTVFEIHAGSHDVTTLATVGSSDEPLVGPLVDAAGDVYSTTGETIFEIPAASHSLTAFPLPVRISTELVMDAAGNLYGAGGGSASGSAEQVFELTAGSHALTTLSYLANRDGLAPSSAAGPRGARPSFVDEYPPEPDSLVLGAAGDLFVTTISDTKTTLFDVRPFQVGVTATLTAPPVTAAAPRETITVVFSDPAGIDPSSIRAGGLVVAYNKEPEPLEALGVSVSPGAGRPDRVTAKYTVAGALGFSPTDNGAWTADVRPGAAFDVNGASNAQASASFLVAVPPAGADAAFGGGAVAVHFTAEATAVQPDGKVLLAGHEPGPGGSTRAVLERLDADGSADPSFGAGGVTESATDGEAFYGLALQSDGSVVVSGTGGGGVLLARYTAAGAPDPSFGTRGRATFAAAGAGDATAYAVALDGAGDPVVAGSAGGLFLVGRFTAAGAPDPSFNGGQLLRFGNPGAGNVLGRLVAAADGSIVAAGSAAGSVVAVRVTAAGALDPSFGIRGATTVTDLAAPSPHFGTFDRTFGLALLPSGDILVAGQTPGGDFGTVGLTPGGAPVTNFGLATTDFGGTDAADAVSLLPDGTILVSGTSSTGSQAATAVAAYTPTGLPTHWFGDSSTEAVFDAASAATAPGEPDAAPDPGEVFTAVAPGGLVVVESGRAGAAASQVRSILAGVAGSGDVSVNVTTTLATGLTAGAVVPHGRAAVTVSNDSVTLSGQFTVQLYLAGTGLPAPGVALAAPLTKSLRLKYGARRSIQVNIASLPPVPAGVYDVLAVVTAPEGVSGAGLAGLPVTVAPASPG